MADTKTFTDTITETEGIRGEIVDRYKYASEHYAPWIKESKEDYKFALGDQWSEEDRQALKEQSRPAMTFNRIRPLINIVSGYQRENSARIKVNPEGGEDRIFSEVMDRGIKFMDKTSHLSHKMGYWFDDGLFCGKGWLEGIITYDKDPVRGELKFKQRTPYQILPDPDCRDYDLNEGARYCFKIVPLPKSELLKLYPKKKKIIDGLLNDNSDDPTETTDGSVLLEGDNDDYENREALNTMTAGHNDSENESELGKDEKFTVKEYWHVEMIKKYFVVEVESGEPRKFDDKEKAEAFVVEQGSGKVIEREVPEMHVSAYCAGWMLQKDEVSPFEPFYSGFPFFRFMADWAPNAEDEVLRVQGITRMLKDPQKEKNKAKSQNLHILNTQANSGWIGDDNALPNDAAWKKLEQMGAKPGIVIKKKPGAELREIQAKGPNVGMLERESRADDEFKQIVGFNPEFLAGMEGQSASGKAVSIRVKNLILSLVRLFANYRYSKEIIGKFMLQMIPMLFDDKKLIKVIGPQYMSKALDPEKYPEGLKEGHISAFLQMVKDNKYDVFVAEADANATIRYEIFQELTALLKAGAPIPVDLLIDYLDIPNSEEVKQKIKEQQQAQAAAEAAKGKQGA